METAPTKYGSAVPNSDSEATLEGEVDWEKNSRHRLFDLANMIIANINQCGMGIIKPKTNIKLKELLNAPIDPTLSKIKHKVDCHRSPEKKTPRSPRKKFSAHTSSAFRDKRNFKISKTI